MSKNKAVKVKAQRVGDPARLSFQTGGPTNDFNTDMWAALGRATVEARHLEDGDLKDRFAYWDARGVRKGRKTTTARWFATSMLLTYGSEIAFRRYSEA